MGNSRVEITANLCLATVWGDDPILIPTARMATQLETRLGYIFRNPDLLELALTHSSKAHEQKRRLPHNERLEFLGDAVLELVTADYLYHLLPDVEEGRLTKIRAHLVNRSALAEMARSLDLGDDLLLGQAEAKHGGRDRPSTLSNAVEAIVGAVFLDGGYGAARALAVRLIEPRLRRLSDNPEPDNAKGFLQERLHGLDKKASYRIVSESGPPHEREFQATVTVEGEVIGTGVGRTKKEAETRAAMAALAVLPQ